jgi:hypothetical protein
VSTHPLDDAPVVTVSGSSFKGNWADGKGGGIAADYASALALSDDNAFSDNTALTDSTTADVYYKNPS